MLKFHVTPITPQKVFTEFMKDECIIVSFLRPENLKRAVNFCSKIYIDNGAYTFFRKQILPDWNKFYKFLENKTFDMFFIPDVIDGSEVENDFLISQVPEKFKSKAIPVWHLHESLERLEALINDWDYIALGSSGKYWKIGTDRWFFRMNEAMKILCDSEGYPKVKIHMLRCLNTKIFPRYPFYSADSSNFAQNHHIRGGANILDYLSMYDSSEKYTFTDMTYQMHINDYLD